VFVVPIGGGGLAAGMALVLKDANPNVRIVGVQSEAVDSMKASVEAGQIVTVSGTTIADGIAVGRPGGYTFPIVQKYVDEIVTVTEDEIAQAVLVLLESEKIVTEGSGAAGVAALLSGKVSGVAGKKVCAILTGGNIDTTFLKNIVARGMARDGRLAKLLIVVPDRPDSVAKIGALAAAEKAHILDIHHRRAFNSTAYRETELELLVETPGAKETQALLNAISAQGYRTQLVEAE
jgi:threonine dehydratase